MFVADKPAALREMRRVLSPGGRLALLVPGPAPRMFVDFEAALTRHIGEEAGAFVGLVFSMADADALRELVASAGFRDVARRAAAVVAAAARRPRSSCGSTWPARRSSRPSEALGDDGRAALEREVVERWAPFVAADGGDRARARRPLRDGAAVSA